MKLSESTKNIFKALSQFRSELKQPKKDANNPQFRSKYVPLESVTDVIDQTAPKHGLAYFQNLSNEGEDKVGVQTVITHESGEYIIFDWIYLNARPFIKGGGRGEPTAHSQGSAISFARRYSLSGAFGIASDVDDDGNHATRPPQQAPPQQRQAPVDPAMEGKQNFLADKSAYFAQEYGVDKKTLYKELGDRLGTPRPIDLPLADLVQALKDWDKELKAQKKAEESEDGAAEEVDFF